MPLAAKQRRGGAGKDSFPASQGNHNEETSEFHWGDDTFIGSQDRRDTWLLDDRLGGGRTWSIQDVLDLVPENDGDILFQFAGGQSLRGDRWTDIDTLAVDLVIVRITGCVPPFAWPAHWGRRSTLP